MINYLAIHKTFTDINIKKLHLFKTETYFMMILPKPDPHQKVKHTLR